MNELDELQAKHNTLVGTVRNLRADMTATSMLLDAMLIAMTEPRRKALSHNVRRLSEHWLADMLVRSTDPTDQALHAAQRAVDHVLQRLAELPHS